MRNYTIIRLIEDDLLPNLKRLYNTSVARNLGYVIAIEYGSYVRISSSKHPYLTVKRIMDKVQSQGIRIGKCVVSPPHVNYRENTEHIVSFFLNKRVAGRGLLCGLFKIKIHSILKVLKSLTFVTSDSINNTEISNNMNESCGIIENALNNKRVIDNQIIMENQIQIFDNPEFGKLRAMWLKGEPWFVGKDIASVLGYTNPRDALSKHVDDEDKGVAKCDTLGGSQQLTIINESGFYSLVLSSKLPTAKKFKQWVTSEVLPSIRKTGSYTVPERHTPNQTLEPSVERMRYFTEYLNNLDSSLHLTGNAKLKLWKEFLANPSQMPVPDKMIGQGINWPNILLYENGINLTIDQFFDMLSQSGLVSKAKVLGHVNIYGRAENLYGGFIEKKGYDYGFTYHDQEKDVYAPVFFDYKFKELCLMLATDTNLKLRSSVDFS